MKQKDFVYRACRDIIKIVKQGLNEGRCAIILFYKGEQIMAIIVKNTSTNLKYILLGTGFGAYKSSTSGLIGGSLFPEEDKGTIQKLTVADFQGNIHFVDGDDYMVVSVDGLTLEQLEEQYNKGINMTAEQYKVFYYVAESGSISKAAKLLFVSQPAVTKSIKVLENELDTVLFIRTSKGVELTREGSILYDYVKEAFTQLEEGEKRLRQFKKLEVGLVRIGISNILCKYYFIPYLKKFHETYPKIKIEIVNRTSPETLLLLEEGKIDCAIISDVGEMQGYHYHHLLNINDTFVSKEKPPTPTIEAKELEKYPLLLLEKKNATRRHFDEYFHNQQIQVNAEIEISSMEFLIEFAKIGLGVSAVIGTFVQQELQEGTLYEWKVEPALPTRGAGLLFKKDYPLSIASDTFIEYMKKSH